MTAFPRDFEGFMLVEDVAADLGQSPATVREWCRRCEFPHTKLSGKRRIFINRSHYAAYMDGCELETKRLGRDGRVVKPRRTKGTQ